MISLIYFLPLEKKRKTSVWTLPFLPGDWHFTGFILDRIPPWGSNCLHRQKCEFYNKKTEGSWDVWIMAMESSAQFQAPWINPGMCFHIQGKGIQQSNQQGHMQWKMTEVASMDRTSSPLQPVSQKEQWHFRTVSNVFPISDSASSLPIFLPLSPTCTLSGTNSLGDDFFESLGQKWAVLEC